MNPAQVTASSVRARLRAHLGLKLTFAFGLSLWAYGPYFWLQRNPFFPVTVMKESALDVWLGFSPSAIWIYLSLFLLMPVAPMQMENTNQLWRYARGVGAMSVVADFIFFFWPTAVARVANPPAGDAYRLLVTWVTPLNAFPSLHAAMAVFSALCCEQILPQVRHPRIWRLATWTWTAAIIWATLSTKEHILWDALGGAMLGLSTYTWAFRRQLLGGKIPRFEAKIITREGSTT